MPKPAKLSNYRIVQRWHKICGWNTWTVPILPSSSEMLLSMAPPCLRRFDLAPPSGQEAERTPELNFSLSTLEEQLELQFPVLVVKEADGGNSSLVDSTALIRNSRPLSEDFNVHCDNSRVASFVLDTKDACFSTLDLRCLSNLHQSQTQFPVSRPSFNAEQYLPKTTVTSSESEASTQLNHHRTYPMTTLYW